MAKVEKKKKEKVYDEKLFQVATTEVIVLADRTRKEFDQGKLRELAESIKRRRQDTPGICQHDDSGRPVLVAGERRLKACELAGVPFTYRLESSVDPLEILEIEIEENLCRINLNWLEEVNAIARLHEIKQKRFGETEPGKAGGWSVADTAEITEKSLGGVHSDLELAIFADKIPEVANAKNKTDAKKTIQRMKKDLERQAALQNVQEKQAKDEGLTDASDFEQKLAYYSHKIHHGKMEAHLVKPALR